MQSTLLSLFSQIADRRRGQGQMYPQAPILLFTVLAMLAGARSYRQVHAFVRTHLDRLNAAFGVSVRKAPAYTTVRFILRGLDAAQVERVFRQHAAALPATVAKQGAELACVAIDGQIILGHLAIAEKSDETPPPRT